MVNKRGSERVIRETVGNCVFLPQEERVGNSFTPYDMFLPQQRLSVEAVSDIFTNITTL